MTALLHWGIALSAPMTVGIVSYGVQAAIRAIISLHTNHRPRRSHQS